MNKKCHKWMWGVLVLVIVCVAALGWLWHRGYLRLAEVDMPTRELATVEPWNFPNIVSDPNYNPIYIGLGGNDDAMVFLENEQKTVRNAIDIFYRRARPDNFSQHQNRHLYVQYGGAQREQGGISLSFYLDVGAGITWGLEKLGLKERPTAKVHRDAINKVIEAGNYEGGQMIYMLVDGSEVNVLVLQFIYLDAYHVIDIREEAFIHLREMEFDHLFIQREIMFLASVDIVLTMDAVLGVDGFSSLLMAVSLKNGGIFPTYLVETGFLDNPLKSAIEEALKGDKHRQPRHILTQAQFFSEGPRASLRFYGLGSTEVFGTSYYVLDNFGKPAKSDCKYYSTGLPGGYLGYVDKYQYVRLFNEDLCVKNVALDHVVGRLNNAVCAMSGDSDVHKNLSEIFLSNLQRDPAATPISSECPGVTPPAEVGTEVTVPRTTEVQVCAEGAGTIEECTGEEVEVEEIIQEDF